jgi:hypothetical protein
VATVIELQRHQRLTLEAGVRPDRPADFWTVMAEMRDQGFDPYVEVARCILGPFALLRTDRHDRRLVRCLFRIPGSRPTIEFEVDLLPGLLTPEDCTVAESRVKHPFPEPHLFDYRPEWHTG